MGLKYKVLVFPAGTEIGLEINSALRHCKEVELYAAGTPVSNHAPFVFQRFFALPSINDSDWLDVLVTMIEHHQIDFIIPAHDDVIVALATNAQAIPAKIITSPVETCLLTRSKRKTYAFFADILPVPVVYVHPDEIPAYPVFVKPDIGQGSQGAKRVDNAEQLTSLIEEYAANRQQPVIMRYLPGAEYTIDCFTHRTQGLLYCAGRERIRTRNGISMASQSIENDVFLTYARIISSHLALHGAWFFQLKVDHEGQFVLLEIAPRIAGTMALSRVKGVNFPLLSLYEAMGMPLKITPLETSVVIDRALVNRYAHAITFDCLYIDLDDTIIINGSVNPNAIKLIFQCISRDIRVVLITRHAGDLTAFLKRYHLTNVFDDVIHLTDGQEKSDYIQDMHAIFVDDSFAERQRVHARWDIPTFDCSMIELLLDDRV